MDERKTKRLTQEKKMDHDHVMNITPTYVHPLQTVPAPADKDKYE